MEKKVDSLIQNIEEQYDEFNFEVFNEQTVEVGSIEVHDHENHTIQSTDQIIEDESESEYPKLEFENSEAEDSLLDIENSKLDNQLFADENMELDDQIVEVENIDYSENDVFYNKSPTATMSEVVLAYELENAQCSSAVDNDIFYEPQGLTKLLSIKLDKPISHHYDVVSLRNEIDEIVDKHKELSNDIKLAKEIVTSFSMQAVANIINESNINFLVSATILLQKVLAILKKQELQLLDLQRSINHLPPLEVLADYVCKKNENLHLNFDNDKRTENSKCFYTKNENKLKKCIGNLEKKQKIHIDQLKEKSKIIMSLKKKIFIMRKQMKMASFPPHESNNLSSTQMLKINELITMTNSLVNSVNKKSNYNPFFKQIIGKKDNKIYELNGTIENRNKKLKQALKREKEMKMKYLILKKKNENNCKKKDAEILELKSAIERLNKKHDRWMIDRFYQKCHSTMLFEKVRKTERKQNEVLKNERLKKT